MCFLIYKGVRNLCTMICLMGISVTSLAATSVASDSNEGNTPMTVKQREAANKKARELGYVIGPGDRIKIRVFDDPDMNIDFLVDKQGNVNFSYIGQVVVSGKTPRQIEDYITEKLKGEYLIDPVVTVTMESFRQFYITGEVEDPSGYQYQPGLTVEKALALAGGFTDRADRDEINIRLSGSKKLLKNVEMTHPVHPGDTVIVAMSFF
ncbi:MAG: polysaccharide biosynthesis/export family protein [Psychromonas sp.]